MSTKFWKNIRQKSASFRPHQLVQMAQEENLAPEGQRDALYREYGVLRALSLERLAVSTLGDNARRRQIDSWKRNDTDSSSSSSASSD